MSARRCALTLAPTPPLRTTDDNDIPLKFYDIVDEYETEAAAPVKDEERDALARYFQLLIARLTNNEEIDEEAQREMAREAAINENRIDDIANFLNQWGNE
ncbi:YmjA family protein [Klebsiella pneumoniae]|nr:YmjA family protein [Klebsiella pneumoniae]MDW1477624.1 YmjA family protein [Klebsiella pneumoniae]